MFHCDLFCSGHCGQLPSRPTVILIGTHADKVGCPKNARGEYVSPVASSIYAKVQQKFKGDIDLVERAFVMDSQVAMTTDIKALKQQLYQLRSGILRVSLTLYQTNPSFMTLKKNPFINIMGKGETSIFSFSHNVCYPITEKFHHLNHIEIVVC